MTYRYCPLCAEPLITLPDGNDAGLPGCATGHFVNYANPAVTTFAFIEDDGRYLALRRAHEPLVGTWDMPGGFVEAGEYPDDAIRREILEETGLEVDDLEVFGAWTGQYGDGGKWTVDIAYRCRKVAGEFAMSAEKSEAIWVPLDEFPEPAFNSERIALEVLRARAEARNFRVPT
jgi:ADP-ribose pyrophosphatase YjhB (NUDIX family)